MEKAQIRAKELTQRLDHSVPDPEISAAANQSAAADLAALSAKLHALLPDNSLSPIERLERLGRVVENRTPKAENLQSAIKKLDDLKARLDELVPGALSPSEKIDLLHRQLNEMVAPEMKDSLAMHKLEVLGDPRARVAPDK